MFSIRVDIDDKALAPLKNLGNTLPKEVDVALRSAALLVEGTAKKKISHGGRSGRLYSGRRGGRSHQASAPGQPPKTDTGRLVASITHNFEHMSAEVGSDVLYAPYLEMGTSKMSPRPWLKPSLDENEGNIQRLITDAVNRALK
jgi:HK97 gp10 family phage protein